MWIVNLNEPSRILCAITSVQPHYLRVKQGVTTSFEKRIQIYRMLITYWVITFSWRGNENKTQ